MAVPKKKKSLSRNKKKYISNNFKLFKSRKTNYDILSLFKILLKKENWISTNFISKKNKIIK